MTNTALIVFSSSVSGSRLKSLAQRAMLRDVRIVQTPTGIKSGGCSYSLRVSMQILDEVLNIAARHNVRYFAVYAEEKDISGTTFYKKLH